MALTALVTYLAPAFNVDFMNIGTFLLLAEGGGAGRGGAGTCRRCGADLAHPWGSGGGTTCLQCEIVADVHLLTSIYCSTRGISSATLANY